MSAKTIRRRAHAKINLFLRVLGAREDGYHEIESLVTPISLADLVVVRSAGQLRVETEGVPAFAEEGPAGGLNLALVAALALADACPDAAGALVEIEKRIPVAAGLGGGSADAAATLHALNALWGCDVDAATLEQIGERIGSDVPAMLSGEPVLMAGRGERLAPADVATFHWVLVPVRVRRSVSRRVPVVGRGRGLDRAGPRPRSWPRLPRAMPGHSGRSCSTTSNARSSLGTRSS